MELRSGVFPAPGVRSRVEDPARRNRAPGQRRLLLACAAPPGLLPRVSATRLQALQALPGPLPAPRDARQAGGVRRHRKPRRAARQPAQRRPPAPDDHGVSRWADRRQRVLGLRVGQHDFGCVRQFRDRRGQERRSALLDDPRPTGPRDRRVLRRCLRRHQHRAAPPSAVRLGRGVVGLLHADPHRSVRAREHAGAAEQQPVRLRLAPEGRAGRQSAPGVHVRRA